MNTKYASPKGSSWDDVRGTFLTPTERANSERMVAVMVEYTRLCEELDAIQRDMRDTVCADSAVK